MKVMLFHLILLSLVGVVFSANSTESTDLNSIKASKEVSVSGVSSGGAMAGQMIVAYSSKIKGAGIFAAPPYFCTKGAAISVIDCMTTGVSVFSDQLVLAAKGFEKLGQIDSLSNMKNKKIYMFSGKRDSIVWSGVVKKNEEFFRKLGANIETEYSLSAEHTFPTDFFGNSCGKLGKPFINNCDFKGSKHALEHIVGQSLNPKVDYKEENLKSFNQKKYQIGFKHSLDNSGMIYVPDGCKNKACELHVAFHGCEQTTKDIGLDYVYGTGFLGLAEANDFIVLFPQVKKSIFGGNPQGCWDWWGYSETIPTPLQWVFPTQSGVQMRAIDNMISDLQSGSFELHSEFAFKDIPKSSY
ncbi:unnamed protein product [Moneuplotes crassus]|uniref:Poly(3-hydroxybutyrate) depolymerase n=1 Tax=Euplotes crassus TaxID=5936 RepID=A0AAD1XHF3_EUPCR|nr:unnamed protein product [Moneuplotes crassus]